MGMRPERKAALAKTQPPAVTSWCGRRPIEVLKTVEWDGRGGFRPVDVNEQRVAAVSAIQMLANELRRQDAARAPAAARNDAAFSNWFQQRAGR